MQSIFELFGIPVRHKIFVSYHHANDQKYRDYFEYLFCKSVKVFISKSVQIGDINPLLPVDTVREKIRDEYLRDSSVTVVLVGTETWKRKHVDWEIASSIRQTKHSSRSGLLGIILPTHPDFGKQTYTISTVPPRLHYNAFCGYAEICDWTWDSNLICNWIQRAFDRRNTLKPDNSYPHFVFNRNGQRWTT